MKPEPLLAILSVAIAALFTGCKSAKPTTVTTQSTITQFNPAPAPAPASYTDTRPLIVCFGDSLTAGYGTDPGEAYPDDLQRLLDAQGFHYRVLNLGVSGNTTKDGLDRVDRVIAHNPAMVVVEFGGNDGLRGLPMDQTRANLAAIIQQLQAAHIAVALAGITLPPDYGKDYIAQLVAIYPALAKQFHVPLLPFLLQDVYNVPGDMQEDATHATAQGNKQVALNVAKLITPLLKK